MPMNLRPSANYLWRSANAYFLSARAFPLSFYETAEDLLTLKGALEHGAAKVAGKGPWQTQGSGQGVSGFEGEDFFLVGKQG